MSHNRSSVEWAGVLAALAILAMVLQIGSPGFALADDGVWTLAKHFPKSQQQRIEKQQKRDRGKKEANKTARDEAIPVNVDVPNLMLGLYQEYAGNDWPIVAGIYKIESDHGRSKAPGMRSGVNTFGCCAGPGQFNVKAGTWQTWRRSPKDNVYDPRDSVPATVRMLRAFKAGPNNRTCSGALARHYGPDWVDAIRHYNNACWYVEDVLSWARTYSKAPVKRQKAPSGLTFTRSRGCDPARDWREGTWTPEVRGFLIKLSRQFDFRVSCGAFGHSRYVRGTNRESAHWTGRAFDVDVVNRQPVAPGSDTAFAEQALAYGARQVGGPVKLCGGRRCFTNAGHKYHWHVQP